MAGKSGACPGCSRVVQVPAAAEPASDQRTVHPPAAAEDTAPAIPDAIDLAPSPDYPFLASPQEPDELGRLGPYRVLKVLGTGAMGVVFQAEDPHLKRMVALKVMRPSLAASAEFHRRFLREARLSASIDHEHIVTIYQVGEDRGVPFLAMQLLQGETLENRLERAGGRLPLADVLRIGREVAEGLAAAHARSLIHRDIKPANLWLERDRGRVKIVDFGLARGAEPDAQFTQAGAVIGTPAYMAPEQADAAVVDARSDLFSLGAVLYRAATGETPFGGKDTLSVLSALATRTPTPPHRIVPSLPRLFSGLVMRLLAKDPADRPQSASEVVEAIEGLERGDAEGAAVASNPEAPLPQPRKKGEPGSPPPSAAGSKAIKSRGPAKSRPRTSRKGKRTPARRDWGPLVLTVGVSLLVVAALFLFIVLLIRAK